MFEVLLAGASALVWGTADFCGGMAASREPADRPGRAMAVTVVSQLYSAPIIALFLWLIPGSFSVSALGWGAAGGIAGFFGIVLLYRSLAAGRMSVVAPTTAVTAAVVPVVAGILMGERPSPLALAGAGCALVAIALVSMTRGGPGGPVPPRILAATVTAGALFGLFFLLLAQADSSTGVWAIAGSRLGSLAVALVLVRATGTSLRLGRPAQVFAVAAGQLDALANGFYLVAVQHGQLSLVAPVASLYPASTVLLALAVQRERLRPLQVGGLALATVALVVVGRATT